MAKWLGKWGGGHRKQKGIETCFLEKIWYTIYKADTWFPAHDTEYFPCLAGCYSSVSLPLIPPLLPATNNVQVSQSSVFVLFSINHSLLQPISCFKKSFEGSPNHISTVNISLKLQPHLSDCQVYISTWMSVRHPKLNVSKTKLLIFPLKISSTQISPAKLIATPAL